MSNVGETRSAEVAGLQLDDEEFVRRLGVLLASGRWADPVEEAKGIEIIHKALEFPDDEWRQLVDRQ